jgi:hypothetical protein
MFENDIVQRTHYTSLEDGRNSFGYWAASSKVLEQIPSFEYEEGFTARGKRIIFKVDCWGGYIDQSGRWVIFVAWRSAAVKVTKYYRWFWDDKTSSPYDLEIREFVN